MSRSCCLTLLAATLVSVAASAQEPLSRGEPSSQRREKLDPHQPTTEASLRDAIQDLDNLARGLQAGLKSYHEHLRRAMQIYGQGFLDPARQQKLPGFGEDIQTDDAGQTARVKLAVFASLMSTASIHLDPDPLRSWANVENLLTSCDAILDRAHDELAHANIYVAASNANIPADVLKKLRKQGRTAFVQAEKERDRARVARPKKLDPGQTFTVQTTEGLDLQLGFFPIEFGREWANVTLRVQLTYSGKTDGADVFLLSILSPGYVNTRVYATVRTRAILVYSDPRDSLRYGHAVASYDYGSSTVLRAGIAGKNRPTGN